MKKTTTLMRKTIDEKCDNNSKIVATTLGYICVAINATKKDIDFKVKFMYNSMLYRSKNGTPESYPAI